jgi:hypothetical protein
MSSGIYLFCVFCVFCGLSQVFTQLQIIRVKKCSTDKGNISPRLSGRQGVCTLLLLSAEKLVGTVPLEMLLRRQMGRIGR